MNEEGWKCPECKRVWAPKVQSCYACNNRGKGKKPTIPSASYGTKKPERPAHLPKLLDKP